MDLTTFWQRHGRAALMAGAMLGLSAGTSATAQEPREWAVTGLYEQIVATDCRDCGDDIGMMIECRGLGQPARATVQWAAVERVADTIGVPLTIVVDGKAFDYRADVEYYGQIGYTPTFAIAPGDPVIEALRAGRTATVQFSGASVDIALAGSNSALLIFAAHCGWTGAGASQTTGRNSGSQDAGNRPVPPSDGGGQPVMPRDGGGGLSDTGDGIEVAQGDPVAEPTVVLSNTLSQAVDYFYIDAGGQAQFIHTMAPGEVVEQPGSAGLELVFAINAEEIGAYVMTGAAAQAYRIGDAAGGQAPDPQTPGGGADVSQDAIAADANGMRWQFYDSVGGGEAVLIYGVPETDAAVLVATCRPASGAAAIEFYAAREPEGGRGSAMSVVAVAGGNALTLQARVNELSRPMLDTARGDAFWSAIAGGGPVTLVIGNAPAGQIQTNAGLGALRGFRDRCGI